MEEFIYRLIENIGFPAAIAIVVLLKNNKTMERIERAFSRNTSVLLLVLKGMKCDDKTIETLLKEEECTDDLFQK